MPVVAMTLKFFTGNRKILIFAIPGALAVLVYLFGTSIWERAGRYYYLISDKEQIKVFITSFGAWAPLVFVTLQISQVLFAPVPGEVTGFVGGYLFGATKGFIYSSIGLTVGSWINFMVGRFLGKRYVRKLIPATQLNRFDIIIKRQGIIVVFLLFVIPGFPKDYLCLFLGLSTIPAKVFIILAAIGRMPGTFMLSLQGAFLFEQAYVGLAIIAGLCIMVSLFGYRYRLELYQWVERLNRR